MNKKTQSMTVVYEDEDIIVVDKPFGLITIKDHKTPEENTLYHQVYEHVYKRNRGRIFIVHRLDKDTSGLVVFAKTGEMKELLQKQFEEQSVERKYEAVVEGKLNKDHDRLKMHLITDRFNNVFAANKGGVIAITDYKVIKCDNKFSVLDIQILTGKRNQIRASFAKLNHPIVGDKKYGSSIKSKLCLRAYSLKFNDNLGLRQSSFETYRLFDNYLDRK